MIEITQADYEAAAAFWAVEGPFRMGTTATLAKAFAQHRLQARTQALEEAAQVADRITMLEGIIQDTLWMACRYAHGRSSYATARYNEAARKAMSLDFLKESGEPRFAIDGSKTREMSGLSEAEFLDARLGWLEDHAIPNHCRSDW